MRMCVGVAVVLTACGFHVGGAPDAPPDMSPDMPPDMAMTRVRTGLVGFWTFDDAAGTVFLADTAGAGAAVPVEIITQGGIPAPAITGGNLVATLPGRLYSAQGSRLAADCATAGAVTLEAWVMPSAATQGAAGEPSFIAGLAVNVGARDIALLQAGDRWAGLVRTSAALDGSPRLTATSPAVAGTMTHLVLVADGTQRILYVNDVAQAMSAPAPLAGWDLTYQMAMIDEYQHARQWTGTLALVALYKKGLSAAEVHQNFAAGPASP